MIILFIITSILYLIMIGFVISLYYTYRKDIDEVENRLLQLEKQINLERQFNRNMYNDFYDIISDIEDKKNNTNKEGDKMACKKGRGGRKK